MPYNQMTLTRTHKNPCVFFFCCRLAVVADISCDVHGSMEFLERTTTTERPFYQYDPALGREVASDIGETGIAVLGLDILPTELAAESSAHFGETVSKIVQELMVCKEQAEETEMGTTGIPVSLLPPGLVCVLIVTPSSNSQSPASLSKFSHFLCGIIHDAFSPVRKTLALQHLTANWPPNIATSDHSWTRPLKIHTVCRHIPWCSRWKDTCLTLV